MNVNMITNLYTPIIQIKTYNILAGQSLDSMTGPTYLYMRWSGSSDLTVGFLWLRYSVVSTVEPLSLFYLKFISSFVCTR